MPRTTTTITTIRAIIPGLSEEDEGLPKVPCENDSSGLVSEEQLSDELRWRFGEYREILHPDR